MKSGYYTTTALLVGIVIVINLLSYEYHLRLDLTEDRQYTLSKATENILTDLEEPVTVKAYFSKDLPPNISRTRQDFQDLLVEYSNEADGQLLYEFINPNENESYEQEATQNGIRPVVINVREKDQMKQQKAFLGASVQMGEKTEVIPFIQPGAAMEYALSTAIKKISIDDKPVIGFVQGHGEPLQSEMTQAGEQLSVLYQVTEVNLTDTTEIPSNIAALALIRPTESIPPSHLQKLDDFLAKGGKLLVAINTVQADFGSLYGSALQTGLDAWLRKKGIDIKENFVVDARCGSVSVPQQFGGFSLQANISFPYLPVIGTFAEHPITSGLESVMLEFASEITFIGDTTKRFVPLAYTSELSDVLPVPLFMDINKEWTENDFTKKHIPVAVALEENISGGNSSKIVIIADGDFAVNGPAQQPRRLQPDNVNLLSNAIDWLADDTGLIALRTKGAVSRPIRELDDTTKAILKYVNFLLPILLVIGYGIFRAQKNKVTRYRRMSENYEILTP